MSPCSWTKAGVGSARSDQSAEARSMAPPERFCMPWPGGQGLDQIAVLPLALTARSTTDCSRARRRVSVMHTKSSSKLRTWA
eukprot:6488841-Amphidinium_carterae.1